VSRQGKWLSILLAIGLVVLMAGTAWAGTYFSTVSTPTVKDGQTAALGQIVITGTSTLTFTGEKNRAEFRLPTDYYITMAQRANENNPDVDVVLKVVRGFEDPSKIEINPISPDPYTPGQFGGVEIIINTKSAGSDLPELSLYFNKVYVPQGASGSIILSVEAGDLSGFSDGSVIIGNVAQAALDVRTEKTTSLVADQKVGPIVFTENIGGAFNFVELSLPGGYSWEEGSVVLDPGLGLAPDYNADGKSERSFKNTVYEDKFGHSVLQVQLQGQPSSTSGTLRVEARVIVDEQEAAAADVVLEVSGDAETRISSLKIGTYASQKVTVAPTGTAPTIYGGAMGWDITEITITENAPGALLGGGRAVTIELPSWARWTEAPIVKVEGSNELKLKLENGRAAIADANAHKISFSILSASKSKAGKVIIYKPLVDLAVDSSGELKAKVKVSSASGEDSFEVTVARVSPPLTVTAQAAPQLETGKQNQAAGDIEIKEAIGKMLLAKELWLVFPSLIKVNGTPQVKITAGDLKIDTPALITKDGQDRLVIPVSFSGTSPTTFRISGIRYDVPRTAAISEVAVQVGGPAVNEVNEPKLAGQVLFPGSEWAARVVNATLVPTPEQPPAQPTTQVIQFQIGERTYKVDNQSWEMDVAPYIQNDRTFLPLRYCALALGVKAEDISWDAVNSIATLVRQNMIVQVKVGEPAVYRYGVSIPIDAPAHIRDGRVMVPLRAVASAFGARIEWLAETRTIKIEMTE